MCLLCSSSVPLALLRYCAAHFQSRLLPQSASTVHPDCPLHMYMVRALCRSGCNSNFINFLHACTGACAGTLPYAHAACCICTPCMVPYMMQAVPCVLFGLYCTD
eukprot:Lankesteria_metandrocarpae@DN897_c0_g1_i1.p2